MHTNTNVMFLKIFTKYKNEIKLNINGSFHIFLLSSELDCMYLCSLGNRIWRSLNCKARSVVNHIDFTLVYKNKQL